MNGCDSARFDISCLDDSSDRMEVGDLYWVWPSCDRPSFPSPSNFRKLNSWVLDKSEVADKLKLCFDENSDADPLPKRVCNRKKQDCGVLVRRPVSIS